MSVLPPVPAVDVHTHLFPDRLARAVRDALHRLYGWSFALPTEPREFAAFVSERGTERFCVLPYAHKPGVARSLNTWVAETASGLPGAVGFACVHQEDDDPAGVLRDAFDSGLRGLKLHYQVQEVAPDDPRLHPVYDLMVERDMPLVVHAGRGPTPVPYTGVEPFRALMRRFPDLRVCVAHLGWPDAREFVALLDEYAGLRLDTSGLRKVSLAGLGLESVTERILFGTDAPNIAFAYDLTISLIRDLGLGPDAERRIFRDNALAFLKLGPEAAGSGVA